MAYDEDLADRIRAVVGGEPGLSEQRMFGGLAFLLDGRLAVAASGRGGLFLRVDPRDTEELVALEHVEPVVMRGKPMDGWLHVLPAAIPDDDALRSWIGRGTRYARTLPPKH